MNVLRFMKRLSFLSPRQRLEWYPPFWLMRVKVVELADDWSIVRLRLPLTAFSRNMGDSMFGGYQAAVADPIAALACAKRFPGHDVWTRAMGIDFVAVGNTDLELRFEFDLAIDAQIREDLADRGRSTPSFEYAFYRLDGVCCSRITNTVAIRPEGYKPRDLSENSVPNGTSGKPPEEL
jgi:acyl-coenzyme A thioesterase PaaI-like protein